MRTAMTIAILALGCGTAAAQMTMTPGGTTASGLGLTSPLGMTSNPAGPTGIPLGSTELNAGGASPAPITPLTGTTSCYAGGIADPMTGGISVSTSAATTGYGAPVAASGASASGNSLSGAGIGTPAANSTFDGGGTAGLSNGVPISSSSPPLSSGCTAVPTGTSAGYAGNASPLSTPGNAGETTLNGGAIPLGATELNTTGDSPILPVAPPAMPSPFSSGP